MLPYGIALKMAIGGKLLLRFNTQLLCIHKFIHLKICQMITKFEELETAKKNVRWLLDHPDGLADMHGLTYWAEVVERLRKEIKQSL